MFISNKYKKDFIFCYEDSLRELGHCKIFFLIAGHKKPGSKSESGFIKLMYNLTQLPLHCFLHAALVDYCDET
jgi:hypothetical protein